MATTLSATLHSAFENNGALRLRADHFLVVLRALGTTVSADEGVLLINSLGIDSEGCVDVRKFCSWFEGMEQDPRFAQFLATLRAKRDEAAFTFADVDGSQPSGQSSDFDEGEDGYQDEDNLHDGAQGHERRVLSFRPQVSADDRSAWPLGSKDRYTLPPRRRLTEREMTKARFIESLNRLKARFELYPVRFRPDLTAQMI
eukprot:TRINITY_DN23248_c0_g2_i1.p1 TRINITY_DN23248_c0_g2~~TRINITY_DN23248_c0_g2_i1.p1  ORF type:complete len:201 (+),score=33.12 TRINITY_DN23248_c0_g2_i1:63-665(+)